MNSHSDHTLHFEAVNSRNRAEVEHLEVFAEQSGFMASVGYDLYVKMIEQSVREMRRLLKLVGGGDDNIVFGAGDLYVTVTVEIPKRLSEKKKNLLRQFDGTVTGQEYEQKKSFFDRVKEAFGGNS